MPSHWEEFEAALAKNGLSFENIKGAISKDDLQAGIKRYMESDDPFIIAAIVKEFENRGGFQAPLVRPPSPPKLLWKILGGEAFQEMPVKRFMETDHPYGAYYVASDILAKVGSDTSEDTLANKFVIARGDDSQPSPSLSDFPAPGRPKKHRKPNPPTPIGAVTPCDTAGQFVEIPHLDAAGLDTTHKRRLFVREEWAKLWNKSLNGKNNLFLTGPPGTGKSSLVWAWCLWYAAQKNPIRWVHIPRSQEFYVVDFLGDGSFTQSPFSVTLDIESTSAPTLIIDGVTKDCSKVLTHAVGWWREDRDSNRLIVVSSLQFGWGMEDYELYRMQKLSAEGWTTHEYEIACQDVAFYNAVSPMLDADTSATTPKEQIAAKLFFVGSSARWMFHFNTEKAISDIQDYLRKATSATDLLKGIMGDRGVLAVNHLTTTVEGSNTLVSQYVTRQLAKTAEIAFVEAATRYSTSLRDNGSFDGWVFQMDFLYHLQSAQRAKTTLQFTHSPDTWAVPVHYDFYKEEDLKLLKSKLIDECWLIPTKINQGCYDVLQLLLSTSTLRVVQLTVSSTHSLKLRYVITILAILEQLGISIKHLDVVVVLPPQNVDNFKLGQVESDKHASIGALGWKPSHCRRLGFRRAGIMYDL